MMKTFRSLDSLTITYEGKPYKVSVKDLLSIDEDQLLQSIENTPMYMGYLSLLKNKLTRKFADKKLKLQKYIGDLYILVKEDPDWEKPPTEKHVESTINSNESIMDQKREINDLEKDIELLEGLIEALRHKVSLIQTLSANLRNH